MQRWGSPRKGLNGGRLNKLTWASIRIWYKASGASPLGVARAACFEELAGVFASSAAIIHQSGLMVEKDSFARLFRHRIGLMVDNTTCKHTFRHETTFLVESKTISQSAYVKLMLIRLYNWRKHFS